MVAQNPIDSRLETPEQGAPAAVADLAHALGRTGYVHEEHRRQEAVYIAVVRARTDDELLDRAKEVRVADRPVIGAVALEQPGAGDVSGQVVPVGRADEPVVTVVDDKRRRGHQRQD